MYPQSNRSRAGGPVFARALASAGLIAAFAASPGRAAEYHVPLTPENAAIGCFPADKAPVITVKSGDIVMIDGGGGSRWGDQNPDEWLKENHIATTTAESPAL